MRLKTLLTLLALGGVLIGWNMSRSSDFLMASNPVNRDTLLAAAVETQLLCESGSKLEVAAAAVAVEVPAGDKAKDKCTCYNRQHKDPKSGELIPFGKSCTITSAYTPGKQAPESQNISAVVAYTSIAAGSGGVQVSCIGDTDVPAGTCKTTVKTANGSEKTGDITEEQAGKIGGWPGSGAQKTTNLEGDQASALENAIRPPAGHEPFAESPGGNPPPASTAQEQPKPATVQQRPGNTQLGDVLSKPVSPPTPTPPPPTTSNSGAQSSIPWNNITNPQPGAGGAQPGGPTGGNTGGNTGGIGNNTGGNSGGTSGNTGYRRAPLRIIGNIFSGVVALSSPSPSATYYGAPPSGAAYPPASGPGGFYNRNFDAVSSQTTFAPNQNTYGSISNLADAQSKQAPQQTVVIIDSNGKITRLNQESSQASSGSSANNASGFSGTQLAPSTPVPDEQNVQHPSTDLFAPIRNFFESMLFGPLPAAGNASPQQSESQNAQNMPGQNPGLQSQTVEGILSAGNPTSVPESVQEGPTLPPADHFQSGAMPSPATFVPVDNFPAAGQFAPAPQQYVPAAENPPVPGPGREVAIEIGVPNAFETAGAPAEEKKKGILETVGTAIKTVASTIATAVKATFARLFFWL